MGKIRFILFELWQKKIWYNDNGGDYYQGETYLCTNCDAQFNLPSEPYDVDDMYKESLNKLKEQDGRKIKI